MRKLFLSSLVVGSLLVAFRFLQAALTGGPWSIPFDFFDGGGSQFFPSGGTLNLASAIAGGQVTFMSGGPYTISPGLSSQRPPQADLGQAHAFPIPFQPSLGHTSVTFTRLTAQATIRIYTLSGELVKTLTKNDGTSDSLVWTSVTNERGQGLASGVYIFAVTSPDGQKKIGKLMVIK